MRMNDELTEAFNRQISMELAASTAYLQMAAHFETENLVGMATWMRAQAQEEWEHAHRFLDFVLHRGNRVEIGAQEAPTSAFDSVEAVFAAALSQERQVTKSIHELYRLASEQGDLASFPFLQTFIEEQNEEEDTVETILERVRLAGDSPGAILILDNELGGRSGG